MASVEMNLEIAMSHLGEFGKYQAIQFSLHILAALTSGMHMLSLTTVAAVPPHHCDVNESFAVGNCDFLNENNVTQACDSWIYDTTHFKSSRAMEWNFVCSRRWMGAAAQVAYMLGAFVGSITLGSLADKYGRKVIFYVSSVLQLVFGVSVAFVNEYYTFLVIRFLYGVFGSGGAYIIGIVISMELIGPTKRTFCGMVYQVGFSVGFMLVAFWGFIIHDRFWLQVIYGFHSAVLLGHWWIMDESPRWLWAQGRIKEAIDIIEKGMRINGSTTKLDCTKTTVNESEKSLAKEADHGKYGTCDLFKTSNLRFKTINICFCWFANSIVYYGLSLNADVLLDGNPFLLIFLMGLVDLPSYVFVILVMDRTGRRSLVSSLMLIGGICCVITSSTRSVPISLFGKACIASSFAMMFNYTAELFPTVLRNTAVGMGAMCAKLSGGLTPIIVLLDSFDPAVPAAVFGVLAVISGIMALFLPETLNQPMPETLEDGENFGKGDNCFTSCYKKRKIKDDDGPYEVTS